MKNTSVSDYVAAAMDAALKSQEFKSLFNKFASSHCEVCHKEECDCSMSDDNASNDAPATGTGKGGDPYVFKDDEIKVKPPQDDKKSQDSAKSDDVLYADDSDDDLETEAAYDVAIDSLITASAALDTLGLEKSASLSLKIASLVSKAKKSDKDKEKAEKEKAKKEKEKAKAKAAKEKEMKDKAKAKDKEMKAKQKEKDEKAKALAKAKAEKEKADKAKKEEAKKGK